MPHPVEQQLRLLPDIQPPAGSWQQIVQRRQRSLRRARLRRWLPLAVAAGLALLLLRLPMQSSRQPEPAIAVAADIQDLQQRSRQLEAMLAGLPEPPAVRAASSSPGLAEIEARIAAIDHHLSQRSVPGVGSPAPLWRERVDLMGGLVRARYLEAGAQSF